MADIEELFKLVEEEKLSNDGESFTFSRIRGSGSTLDILRKFRADGEAGFCDVVLEVQGKQFPAHRNVLAANSRFFYAMFTSSMKESSEKHLRLECISLSAFETILNFFYSNDIVINRDNVEELLEASDFLMLGGVKKSCIKVLSRVLEVENCFKIKTLAEKFSADDLEKKVGRFIERNFSFIVEEQEEFLELEPNKLVELISSDELLVESEVESYFAALKWIKHDPVRRMDSFADLLRALKFGSLSKEFLQNQLENEPLFKQNKKCMKVFEQALNEEQNGHLRAQKRSSTYEVKDVIFGHTKFHSGVPAQCSKSFLYDVSRRQTFLLPDIPRLSCDFHIAIVNETIYKVGGTEGFGNTSSGSRVSSCSFGIEKRSRNGEIHWEKKATFNIPRADFATAVLHDCIYVIGGTSNPTSMVRKKTVERYTPEKNEWQSVAPLLYSRTFCSATSDANYIFAIGGAATSSAEKYDPLANAWEQIAPMVYNFGENSVAFVCHVDGKIYTLDAELWGEVYNISKDEWYRIAPPPPGVIVSSFLKFKTDVYAFNITDKVFKYVPSKNEWENTDDCFPGELENFDNFQFYSCQMHKVCLKGLEEADAGFFDGRYKEQLSSSVQVDYSSGSDSQDFVVDEDFEESDSDDSEDIDEDDDEIDNEDDDDDVSDDGVAVSDDGDGVSDDGGDDDDHVSDDDNGVWVEG